jgi:hypothetical protein
VVLCVDNFESFVADDPSLLADHFAEYPPLWRIVAASRVTLNASFVIQVRPLSEQGSLQLARSYFARRGGQGLAEQDFQAMASACYGNPLAIRIVVDAFLAGMDLTQALHEGRERILTFSYASLLNSLPATAIHCMECILALDRTTTVADLGYYLQEPLDEIREALNRLGRTSLVERTSGLHGDQFSLSEATRTLLVRWPRDLAVRHEVAERIRHDQQLVHAARDSEFVDRRDPLFYAYVSPDTPDEIYLLCEQVFRVGRLLGTESSREDVVRLVDLLDAAIQRHGGLPVLRRAKGTLLHKLADERAEVHEYRQGYACQPPDPASGFALAGRLASEGHWTEVANITASLVNAGLGDPDQSSPKSATALWGLRYRAMIESGAADAVVALARDGFATTLDVSTREVHGAMLVAALLRKYRPADSGWSPNASHAIEVEIIPELKRSFAVLGYRDRIVGVAYDLLRWLSNMLHNKTLSCQFCRTICNFCDAHLELLTAGGAETGWTRGNRRVQDLVQHLRRLNCGQGLNPLTSIRWTRLLSAESADYRLARRGYLLGAVLNPPRGVDGTPKDFVFVRSDRGADYFVSLPTALKNETQHLSHAEFYSIGRGDLFGVIPDWTKGAVAGASAKGQPTKKAVLIR